MIDERGNMTSRRVWRRVSGRAHKNRPPVALSCLVARDKKKFFFLPAQFGGCTAGTNHKSTFRQHRSQAPAPGFVRKPQAGFDNIWHFVSFPISIFSIFLISTTIVALTQPQAISLLSSVNWSVRGDRQPCGFDRHPSGNLHRSITAAASTAGSRVRL